MITRQTKCNRKHFKLRHACFLEVKESLLSFCMLLAYQENRLTDLLHTWHVCCWGPTEVQCWLWCDLDTFIMKKTQALCRLKVHSYMKLTLKYLPIVHFHSLGAQRQKDGVCVCVCVCVLTVKWTTNQHIKVLCASHAAQPTFSTGRRL